MKKRMLPRHYESGNILLAILRKRGRRQRKMLQSSDTANSLSRSASST